MVQTIGNPLSWVVSTAGSTGEHVADATARLAGDHDLSPPVVREISGEDIGIALRRGFEDFAAMRSDVIFIVALYPVIGLLMAALAFNSGLAHHFFPAASGFALIGPVAAIGLYEFSRLREQGQTPGWGDAFGVLRSPSLGPIVAMSLYLGAIYAAWMVAAFFVYSVTLGPEPPTSMLALLTEAFTTGAGWAMIVIGCAVGFAFAVLVLVISAISLPLLVDRPVGLVQAVVTSVEVARRNPRVMALWGLVVAVLLAVGSVPFFLGLVVVMPVLGHATWHLYRRAVEPA
ncbi:DUF2189 domain-containing protein [Rhodobacterales bacterium HKCCE2091]|nr:DUF2189 domain-containing protein [Rhodobacterales bacterium HKCCE2091]